MLTADEVLHELEALGTEQYRKTYRRHGVKANVFGVSYADFKKIAKKLKINQDIALALWASQIHDARVLALMIADPEKATSPLLDTWVCDLSDYIITDALSGYVAKTALVRQKMEQWTQSPEEYTGAAGWNLLGHLALHDQTLPDAYFKHYLVIIERDLQSSKNRARFAMNNALIAIGTRNSPLAQAALAVATRVGKVIVDHGETNCKTLDAMTSIQKATAYVVQS